MARNPAEIVRLTSTVRAVEAAGGAVASGISSTHAPLIAAVGVNFGLWALAVIPTWFVVRKVGFGGIYGDRSGFEEAAPGQSSKAASEEESETATKN